MEPKRINCIAGTARIKTAIISKQGTDKVFVKLYEGYEYGAHRFISLSQCLSKECRNISEDASAASRRAKTTISRFPSRCCCNLKLSLALRFSLFLAAAFLIFFFAIASPSRGWSNSFRIARIVKNRSDRRIGFAKTFLYSAGFLNRNCGGNVNRSSVIIQLI
jgi:hypothetical protein